MHESCFSVWSLNLLKSVFFREFVHDFVFHRFQHTRLFASTNVWTSSPCIPAETEAMAATKTPQNRIQTMP